jgi:hypothetical protein
VRHYFLKKRKIQSTYCDQNNFEKEQSTLPDLKPLSGQHWLQNNDIDPRDKIKSPELKSYIYNQLIFL